MHTCTKVVNFVVSRERLLLLKKALLFPSSWSVCLVWCTFQYFNTYTSIYKRESKIPPNNGCVNYTLLIILLAHSVRFRTCTVVILVIAKDDLGCSRTSGRRCSSRSSIIIKKYFYIIIVVWYYFYNLK